MSSAEAVPDSDAANAAEIAGGATALHGSAVLRGRIASLTRSLRERERTIGLLLKRLDERASGGPDAAGGAAGLRAQHMLDELREENGSLRDALNRLQHAEKLIAIGRLAAGIAHELNTPIQYVADNFVFLEKAFEFLMGFFDKRNTAIVNGAPGSVQAAEKSAELCEFEYLRADLPEALTHARDGLERIAAIVSAMKRFSHPSNGLVAPTDLKDLIETTVAVARSEWIYIADVVLEFDPALPAVPCIRDDIGKTLLALLLNAAQAVAEANRTRGRERGRIRIGAWKRGRGVEITLADDGNGIAPAHAQRVFEPFFTTKGVGVGTGQGLAVARACVVEHHGGQIWFDTAPGVGTTFHVLLPLATEAA